MPRSGPVGRPLELANAGVPLFPLARPLRKRAATWIAGLTANRRGDCTFYPEASLLAQVAEELGVRGLPGFGAAVIEDQGLAHQLLRAHRLAEIGDVDAESALLSALSALILRHGHARLQAAARRDGASAERFGRCRDPIEASLSEPIDLAMLAGLAKVTRFQVIRDFRRQTGLSPGACIRLRRQAAAARLIERGSSLAQASLAAGFADQSHLCRVFRAIRGITPGAFKAACASPVEECGPPGHSPPAPDGTVRLP